MNISEKKDVKIALVPMISEKAAIDGNLELMKRYIAASRENGVDIICFPEMNITGYIDPVKYSHAVITFEHKAVYEVIKLSGQYNICITAGFVEYNPQGKPYITQFVAHEGKILGFYRKQTIKEGEEDWFAPGDQQPIFSVSGVTFGLSVCVDIDDSEIFNKYAEKGATIVFESAAPGLYGDQKTRNWSSGFHWWRSKCIDQLGNYAAKESLYIGVATQTGRTIDEDFPGGGYLFNPRAGMYG